jgi:hypothetical protein
MIRLLGLSILVYAPHLLEEHLTRMCDDPIIVAGFRPLEDLPARRASYAVFQVMLLLGLVLAYLFALGGKARTLVMAVIALALLGESHHLVRAIWDGSYNSGLVTVLPMPIVGVLIVDALLTAAPCASRSSSPP